MFKNSKNIEQDQLASSRLRKQDPFYATIIKSVAAIVLGLMIGLYSKSNRKRELQQQGVRFEHSRAKRVIPAEKQAMMDRLFPPQKDGGLRPEIKQ
jgi:hypothetical protein